MSGDGARPHIRGGGAKVGEKTNPPTTPELRQIRILTFEAQYKEKKEKKGESRDGLQKLTCKGSRLALAMINLGTLY